MKNEQLNENQPLREATVMPRAITNEDLADAHLQLQESFKPIQKVFDSCKQEFEAAKEELETSFKELLSMYYDQHLIDSEKRPIRIASIITDGKDLYYVFDRVMQIVFGTMLYNNRVRCYKLDKNLQKGKKEHSFGVSELAEFSLHEA